MQHQSDSSEHRQAEVLIRSEVASLVGKSLAPASLVLDSGARVEIDAADRDESVLVEIFAHQGPLKGGQRHKVATDALKLISLARSRPNARKILAFCDAQAATFATRGTWQSKALESWGIEIIIVGIDEATRSGLLAAQLRQRMINPPTGTSN